MGDYALAIGGAALFCSFLPVVGDILAVPAAALAIVLGFGAMRREHTARESHGAAAMVGTILGEVALLVVVLGLAATHLLP